MKHYIALLTSLLIAASANAEVTIPLQVDTVTTLSGSQKYAVGLYVGVAGGEPKLYQLDTGNDMFLPAYAPDANLDPGVTQWWGSDWDNTGSQTGTADFGGRTVTYNTANAGISIYDGPGGNMIYQSPTRYTVAQGVSATTNNSSGPPLPNNWQSQTEAGLPPLLNTYFGNFGAGLFSFSNNASKGLYPLPAQLSNPGSDNLRGYIISIGNLASPINPTLTLLFDSDFSGQDPLADFTLSTDLIVATGDQAGNFPHTGYPLMIEDPLNVQAFEADGQTVTPADGKMFQAVPDTGGTTMEAPDDPAFDGITNNDGIFDSNLDFILKLEQSGTSDLFELKFMTGDEPQINEVQTTSGEEFNISLNLYAKYDIYFDAAGGTMKFRPTTAIPEPSAYTLITGLAGLIGLVIWRRRK